MTADSRSMYAQVARLAGAQALFQTVSVLVITVGGLAGAALAPSPEWATAPIAAFFFGAAATMIPASAYMAKRGRSAGFVLGAGLGTLGALVAALGLALGSLALLVLGTGLIGTYQGFAQYYRFAAAEVASDAFRPRAISLVIAGGVVAAFAGPLVAQVGALTGGQGFITAFMVAGLLGLAAMVVLRGLVVPPELRSAAAEPPRPLLVMIGQPIYRVALFSALTAYGVMILAMTATPIAMAHHQHGLTATATVIQLHVLGMFLPSFFTGTLIARFGVLPIMATGLILLTGHVLLTLTGFTFPSFAAALVLLGLGWNFLYVGGTTLLTRAYRPAEKARAQATNDFIVYLVGLSASLGASLLHASIGWQAMNLLLLPWLGASALVLGWYGWRGVKLHDAIT